MVHINDLGEKDLPSILKGQIGKGKGSKTVVFEDGRKVYTNDHEARRDLYVEVAKRNGVKVDYKVLVDSALGNKYLSKNKVRQSYIISDVVENEAYDVGGEDWYAYFNGSKYEGGLEKEVSSSSNLVKIDKNASKRRGFGYVAKAAVVALAVICGANAFAAGCPVGQRSYSVGKAKADVGRVDERACLDKTDGIVGKIVEVVEEPGLAPVKDGNRDVRPDDFAEDKYSLYKVVKNDTLSGIAEAHKVDFEKLKAANPGILHENWIYPGNTIYVPIVKEVVVEGSDTGTVSSDKESGINPALGMYVLKEASEDSNGNAGGEVETEVVEEIFPEGSVAEEDSGVGQSGLEGVVEDADGGSSFVGEYAVASEKEEGEWKSLYYEDMKRRSAVLDQDGRANPSVKKLGDAIAVNYEGLGEEIDNFGADVGYGDGKTVGRLKSAWNNTVGTVKNLAHFFTGSLYEPQEVKERRAERGTNRFTDWLGAFGGAVYDAASAVVDVADVPTAGVVSDVVGTAGEAVKGTAGTILDGTAAGVGTISYPLQSLEEAIYKDSIFAKTINGGVGLAGRFTENVIEGEAIRHSNFSEDGHDKAVVGPTLEMTASYLLWGESLKKKDGSSDSGGNSIVDDVGDTVNIGDPGTDTPVGR